MKYKFSLVISLVFFSLFLIPLTKAQETVTYLTPYSDEIIHPNGKKGILFHTPDKIIDKDSGKYIPISEAKSLKGFWFKNYIERDLDFDIDVLEVNYTDLILNLSFFPTSNITELIDKYPECIDSKENDIKCDFKFDIKEDVCEFNETSKEEVCYKNQTKFQYKYQLKNGELKTDMKYIYKGISLGKEFTFGGNSTTITIGDTEILTPNNGSVTMGTSYSGNYSDTTSSDDSYWIIRWNDGDKTSVPTFPSATQNVTRGTITETAHPTSLSVGTMLTAAQYAMVNTTGGTQYTVAGSSSTDVYFWWNITLPETSSINWVQVLATMNTSGTTDLKHLALWNFSSNAYVNVYSSTYGTSWTNASFNITGKNITDFISNSNRTIYFLPHGSGTATGNLGIDYMQVQVDYVPVGGNTRRVGAVFNYTSTIDNLDTLTISSEIKQNATAMNLRVYIRNYTGSSWYDLSGSDLNPTTDTWYNYTSPNINDFRDANKNLMVKIESSSDGTGSADKYLYIDDPIITYSSSQEVCGELTGYDTVTINSGVTVTVCDKNATAGTGYWNVTTNSGGTINVYGTISGDGMGFTGGAGCTTSGCNAYQGTSTKGAGAQATAANEGGGGGGDNDGESVDTGGGGGSGGTGGAGIAILNGTAGSGGLSEGTSNNAIGNISAGGGGGSVFGGAANTKSDGGYGAALIILNATTNGKINVTGTITSDGAKNNVACGSTVGRACAAGGGGAGGFIILYATNLYLTGTISADGSAGGGVTGTGSFQNCGGGGGGGGGRLKFFYYSTNSNSTLTSSVALGVGGDAACSGSPATNLDGNSGSVGTKYWENTTALQPPETTPPTYSLNSTNSTLAGTPIKHSLNWTDNVGLSAYIFSFDNCTGTLANDSAVAFGAGTWSNVTKTVNSTVSCTIRWCVYANDTSNNWNGTSCVNPFSYLTTQAVVGPQNYSVNMSDGITFSDITSKKSLFEKQQTTYASFSEALQKPYKGYKLPSDYITYSDLITKSFIFLRKPTEAITYSEIVTLLELYQKSRTDSISYYDLLTKLRMFNKQNIDSLTYYDILYKYKLVGKPLSDTITYGDLTKILSQFSKNPTEAITYYDLISKLGIYNKQSTDSITYWDIIAKASIFSKSLTDTITYGDIVNATVPVGITENIREVFDIITYGDLIGRYGLFNKGLTDTMTYSDLITRLGLYSKSKTDSITYYDLLVKLGLFNKQRIDSLTYYDLLTKAGIFRKGLNDTITYAEIISKLSVYGKSSTSTISYSEILTKLGIFSKSPTSTITFNDFITKLGIYKKIENDTITYGELLTKLGFFNKANSNSIAFFDALSKLGIFNKGYSDTITYGELIDKFKLKEARMSDSLTFADFLSKLGIFNKEKTDSITYGDLLSNLITTISKLTSIESIDAISFGDLLRALGIFTKSTTTQISYSELIDKLGLFKKQTTDTMTYGELYSTLGLYNHFPFDSMTYGDLLEKLRMIDKSNSDQLTFYEILYKAGIFKKSLTDTIYYYDLLPMLNNFFVSPTDSITYSEILTKLRMINIERTNFLNFGDMVIRLSEFNIQIGDRINYFDNFIGWLTCLVGNPNCQSTPIQIGVGGTSGRTILVETIKEIIIDKTDQFFVLTFVVSSCTFLAYLLPKEKVKLKPKVEGKSRLDMVKIKLKNKLKLKRRVET